MKKCISYVLVLAMLVSSLFIINNSQVNAIEATVNMDSKTTSDIHGWVARYDGDYATSQVFLKSNNRVTLQNNDISKLEHVTTMYSNVIDADVFQITAKIEWPQNPGNVWNAFIVRSSGYLSEGPFDSDKYLIAILPNQNVVLYRINNGVSSIASGTISNSGFDYAAENKYEITCTNDSDSTDITFRVNDLQVLTYSDTSADRVTEDGYFGYTAYNNTSNSILGDYVKPPVTIDMDTKTSGDIHNWVARADGDYLTSQTFLKADNRLTLKNNDTSKLEYVTAMYPYIVNADKISITAKIEWPQSPGSVFNAFFVRAAVYVNAQTYSGLKYFIAVKPDKQAVLYKVNSSDTISNLANGNITDVNFDYNSENKYEISCVNDSDSVYVTFSVNGVNILSYDDMASDRISQNGYFGYSAYNNTSKTVLGSDVILPEPINLDTKTTTDSDNWIARSDGDYATYQTFVKSNNKVTIRNTDITKLEQVTTMYKKAVDNDIIRLTATIEWPLNPGNVWNAFIVRSAGYLSEGPFNSDKYFITVNPNKQVVLYRVFGGDFIDIASGYISNASFDYATENVYEISCIDDEDSVYVTFSVNGVPALTYDDSSSDRITGHAYFGYCAYGNTSNSILGEFKETEVNLDLDKKLASDTAGWTARTDGDYLTSQTFKKVDESLFIQNNDTAKLEHVTTMYSHIVDADSLKVTAKIEWPSNLGTNWNAFIARSAGYNMEGPFNSDKYLISIKPDKQITLYRQKNELYALANANSTQVGVDFSVQNTYEIYCTNDTDSVNIIFSINGVKVLEYSDTSADRIITDGYFGYSAYNNTSLNVLGKFPEVIPVPNAAKWDESSSGILTQGTSSLTIGSQTADKAAYYNVKKYRNANFNMDLNFTYSSGTWTGIVLRSNYKTDTPFTVNNTCYEIIIFPTYIELFKNKAGSSEKCISMTSISLALSANTKHSLQIGIEDTNNGVRIFMVASGAKVFDYTDTTDPLLYDGYFGVHTWGNDATFSVKDPVLDNVIADNALRFGAANDEFPIGLWCPTNYNYFSETAYSDIADANYNYVVGLDECYGGKSMMAKALDYADKYNLKMWVNDPFIRSITAAQKNTILQNIVPYKNKNAYLGNIFRDEPDGTQMDAMFDLDQEMKRVAPNAVPYFNLLPDYATPTQLGFSTWPEYLDHYINTYDPKYISYDYYPLTFSSDPNMSYDFSNSLSIISGKAKLAKIPLWTSIQTQRSSTQSAFTAGEIKYQTYMNLAFGAKSLTYWSYAVGIEHLTTDSAIIANDGTKSYLYDIVKTVNSNVKAMGKVLLTLDTKGVMIHNPGHSAQSYELASYAPISSLSGDSYLVSCLENSKGNKKIMVVNFSPSSSSNASITFNGNSVGYYQLWRNGVGTSHIMGSDNKIDLNLDPGEGVLIELGLNTGVSIDKSALSVQHYATGSLTATVNRSNTSCDETVIWASSNEAVATVNSSGVVTGVSTGTATITATTVDGIYTSNSSVTVTPVPVTGVTLDYSTATIGKQVTKQLTATVNPSNADNKAVTWSSSNTSVATVSTTGLVTGIAAGTAIITVTTVDGGYTAACTVTVKRYDPSRYYKITYDSNSTLAMDTTTTGQNGVVKNVTYTGANNQQWQIIETTDASTFKIVNRATGYALKVNSTTNSTNKQIIQTTYANANNMNLTINESSTYIQIVSKLGANTYIKCTGTTGGTLVTAATATTTRWDITLLP